MLGRFILYLFLVPWKTLTPLITSKTWYWNIQLPSQTSCWPDHSPWLFKWFGKDNNQCVIKSQPVEKRNRCPCGFFISYLITILGPFHPKTQNLKKNQKAACSVVSHITLLSCMTYHALLVLWRNVPWLQRKDKRKTSFLSLYYPRLFPLTLY